MTMERRKGVARALCGGLLIAASAGCSARDAAPAPSRNEIEKSLAAGTSAAAPTIAAPATQPDPSKQRNDTVTKPGPTPTPPAKPSPAPTRRVIQPSPWQPPAEIDPVRPDVGNAT